jgi:hypothetical protein
VRHGKEMPVALAAASARLRDSLGLPCCGRLWKKYVAPNDQRASLQLNQNRKGHFQLAFGAGMEEMGSRPQISH